MKRIVPTLAAALMALGVVTSPQVLAQSNDDIAALGKCVGYEACMAIQNKIDDIKRGASKVVSTVSNAVSPNDDRSYFEKFSLEERQEAMAACEKNYAGRNCETGYLTPEEIAARHPQAKAAPPLSPEVERKRERDQLGRLDKSVADVMDLKCFTPLMANGQNYGDCADALTQLNRLEKDAKTLGLPLRASALAEQFGFPRNADGTWNDRYARVGEPPKQASAAAEPAAAPSEASTNQTNPDYAALLVKCPRILGCSTEDLEVIVRGSDALRQEVCRGPTCSDSDFKLMSHLEKEVLAKGNLARVELASRSTRPQIAAPSAAKNIDIDGLWAAFGRVWGAGDDSQLSPEGVSIKIERQPGGILVSDPKFPERGSTLASISGNGTYRYQNGGVTMVYQVLGPDVIAGQIIYPTSVSNVEYRREHAAQSNLAAKAVVAPPSTGLNGEWLGQSSGNRVRLEMQPGGVMVTALTQNAGQATTGYLFLESGKRAYRIQAPDGTYAVMQVLGPDKFRTTNPDGWSDVFTRVGASATSQPPATAWPQSAPVSATSTGPSNEGCIGSLEFCYGKAHGCEVGNDIVCTRGFQAWEADRRRGGH